MYIFDDRTKLILDVVDLKMYQMCTKGLENIIPIKKNELNKWFN